ncbi:ABC transporter permease [Raineyella fluvialis]|uniref:FtsX-like permease family protein n=1 Tax=Raineyella fluvialis TaxID=2662261 RepID=A0A5Q2FHE6_9ACTN|nr:ABC transporter permease [Raineyella fluvialis]QGF23756.1 FtsX-like permease family protein [Raineyella fluvialis]
MFGLTVRRELFRRRKETIIIALGMAVATALLIVLSGVSAGIRNGQSQVLQSLYGVGTDITVSQVAAPGSAATPGQRFDFNRDQGSTQNGTTTLQSSRLETSRGSATLDAATVDTVRGVSGVSAATGVLTLNLMNFSGQLPSGAASATAQRPAATQQEGAAGGFGGGSFGFQQTSVSGIDPASAQLGPLASATITDGRALAASDGTDPVAVISSTYASTQSLGVGSTITIGTTAVKVVGIATSGSTTLSDIYLPLGYAQTASGEVGKVNEVYVRVTSADQVDSTATALRAALPSATVSTQADLASSVSGSLASAAKLTEGLGQWVSVATLVLAFLLAMLFTLSGVNRRTRELGTLKAIGWSNKRVVGQITGEAAVRAAIGGLVGIPLGVGVVEVLNAVGITLSGSAGLGLGRPGGEGGMGGVPSVAAGVAGAAASAAGRIGGAVGDSAAGVQVVLHSPLQVSVLGLGLAAAVVGGLLAGLVGGSRAARLSPAVALRSMD